VDGGAAPGQAQYVALVHELPEQVGGDLAQVLRVGRLVRPLCRGLDDDRVPQTVVGTQCVGAFRVQLRGDADLDPDEIALERRLQDPRDLETADAELLRDLDLGFALEVEAAAMAAACTSSAGPIRRADRPADLADTAISSTAVHAVHTCQPLHTLRICHPVRSVPS
jgi:hypothetical protein